MSLVRTVAPVLEPIDIGQAMQALMLDDNAEELRVQSMITASRMYVEETCNLTLLETTWKWTIDRFQWEPLFVPHPPLMSVTSIKYIDGTGTQQTISSSLYTVDEESSPARILPDYSTDWPITQGFIQDVEIIYVAGFGDDPNEVPEPIRQALLLVLQNLYDPCEDFMKVADLLLMPYTKAYARRTDGEVLYHTSAW